MYTAFCMGIMILFHHAYPETKKMTMKINSIQAQILLILTKSLPYLNFASPHSSLALLELNCSYS